jgi:hypothetical protein
MGVWRPFERTSLGFRRNISETRKASSSEKLQSSKTSKNSQPSSSAWIECGTPAGKNHTSPALISSMKVSPFSLTADSLTIPFSIRDHSLAVCQ